jgi:hypothetical protein
LSIRAERAVAALAPGTEIIFEYNVPKALVDEETQKILAAAMTATQARGETQGSFFEPAKLAERVRKIGFAEVSDFLMRQRRDILATARMVFGLSR